MAPEGVHAKIPLSFPVEVRLVLKKPDGSIRFIDHSVEYTPQTWPDAVSDLQAEVLKKFGEPRCLLTLRPIAEATNEEHVVLQGLGTRWIKLPRGCVSAEANNRASKDELEFLRKGLMGTLRTFYLTEGKSTEFEDSEGRRVVFRSSPGGKFKVELYGGPPLNFKDGEGGELVFRLRVHQPADLSVSRTLQKLTYLALCVRVPHLGLSEALDEARRFISGEEGVPYRPYHERFVPGAHPGFHFTLLVEGLEPSPGEVLVERVMAGIRLHHVQYGVALFGTLPQSPVGDEWGTLHTDPEAPESKLYEIAWQFGRVETLPGSDKTESGGGRK